MAHLSHISHSRMLDLLTEEIKGDVRLVLGMLVIMLTAFVMAIVMNRSEPMRKPSRTTRHITQSIVRR